MRQRNGGTRGEARASSLWGAPKGGRGSSGGRERGPARRGLLILLPVLLLAAPLTANASRSGGSPSYLAPSLARAAAQTPNANVRVIVQGATTASAAAALDRYGTTTEQLGLVDAAGGSIRAAALPRLAAQPGLTITPDNPVVSDAVGDDDANGELWTKAVGVDRLWSRLDGTSPPAIAFVDSGIEPGRGDFESRVLANVDLTSLPGNSAGDGYGHGTLVAGIAAGSNRTYPGAAPTAPIVSLDVMDDNGMALTSDVIRAAQWIQQNRRQYDIRVANFSLHSATQTSFRWDPLDKALEKLWFSGVVVVASAGNEGDGHHPVRMGYAPANDPFFVTVGALDVRRSADPSHARVPHWSAWGYTYDGFAKPEVSAPGRAIVGPVPADSTLATAPRLQGKVVRTADGTYEKLSGTSLSTPIVSGIAADLLALKPGLSPDCVKGALMLGAQALSHVHDYAGGVGEVDAPAAAAAGSPPNPNRGLDAFLVPDPSGGVMFDDAGWLQTALASPAWNDVSWSDGWDGAAWSLVSWANVSWSDVSWSDVSWSDVSWSDVSWSDGSAWAQALNEIYGDGGD